MRGAAVYAPAPVVNSISRPSRARWPLSRASSSQACGPEYAVLSSMRSRRGAGCAQAASGDDVTTAASVPRPFRQM